MSNNPKSINYRKKESERFGAENAVENAAAGAAALAASTGSAGQADGDAAKRKVQNGNPL